MVNALRSSMRELQQLREAAIADRRAAAAAAQRLRRGAVASRNSAHSATSARGRRDGIIGRIGSVVAWVHPPSPSRAVSAAQPRTFSISAEEQQEQSISVVWSDVWTRAAEPGGQRRVRV